MQTVLEVATRDDHAHSSRWYRSQFLHIAMWTWLASRVVGSGRPAYGPSTTLSRSRNADDLPRVEPRRSAEAISELACGISRFLRCEGRTRTEFHRRALSADERD